MKTILCVANPIKEVLSAGECLQALEAGVAAGNVGAHSAKGFLMSDGGDGFLDAIGQHGKLERPEVETTGPLGEVITAKWLWDEDRHVAYIESALVCGLGLVEPGRRDVMISGTAGLADVLTAAKMAGAKEIYVGLGGSATCDGGVGFIWRLACNAGQFRPDACEPRVALDLAESASPDLAHIREWLGETRVYVCADVDSPLLGERGASRMFAPQKGADEEQTEQLEAWMSLWCGRLEMNTEGVYRDRPGAGAAGGLGFALACIGAELLPGARTVARLTGLDRAVDPDCILISTEGSFDETSFTGKAPWVAAKLEVEAGGKAAIFCGIASDAAIAHAQNEGVQVIEFGRDIASDNLSAETPGRLSKAVSDFLASQRDVA